MAESTDATEKEDQQAAESGEDSGEGKAAQREERDPPAGEGEQDADDEQDGEDEEGGDDQSEEAKKAQEKEEEVEAAREKIKEFEEGEPPKDLADWPDDAAKYETFGGPEGEHGYHEGPEEEKLGPSSLRHHEDGRVEIEGEEVDDADQYKGDPIPGGPTDPDAGQDLTTEKIREKQGRDLESEDGDGDGDEDGDDSDSDSESSDEEKSEQSS